MDNHLPPILTIGYGNRTFDEFVSLLRQYGVQYLGDVRTTPFSRYSPDFSRDRLTMLLHRHGITYVYMGDLLGGNPGVDAVRITNSTETRHFVDYTRVRTLPEFRQGMDRVRTAWSRSVGLALMCSEAKPELCHRVRLIGVAMDDPSMIAHIDEYGVIRSQDEIMLRIDNGQPMLPGLGESPKASRSSKAF